MITITVVLAATLYVLVSGLVRTTASSPYLLTMGSPQESEPSSDYGYGVVAIIPQNGLTTAMAGLLMVSGSGSGDVALGTAPSSTCHGGAGFNNATAPCSAPVSGIWYAVLLDISSGTVLNVWSLQTGTCAGWSMPPVEFTPGQEIVVVWSLSSHIGGSMDSLTAYPTTSSIVSGASGAF